MHPNTISAWKAKYGGMESSEIARAGAADDENARLRAPSMACHRPPRCSGFVRIAQRNRRPERLGATNSSACSLRSEIGSLLMRKNAQEIVRFYNGIGRHVDAGAFYVDPALARLTVLGEFDAVTRVVEIGGGSGRYAASLLSAALPNDARYVDIEPSETMRELAYSRLAPWRDRVRILASDDFLTKDFEGWAERCIATYVVNVLPDAQTIQGLAQRAHGLLARGGMLCLVNQTHGASLLERVIGNRAKYSWILSTYRLRSRAPRP